MRLDAHARGPFESLRVKRTRAVFVPNISKLPFVKSDGKRSTNEA